jgi:hypothetical protein
MRPRPPDPPDLLSQGARAVRSGRFGELAIEAGFKAYGVRAVNDNREFHFEGDFWQRKDKFLIRQHQLATGRIVDFLYKNFAIGQTMPIECKQQMGGGTTDEKLAYTVDQLEACGHAAFWLVLSGTGFNPDVVKSIDAKIKAINAKGRIKGRLVHNEFSLMQRAVERLVERNEP